MKKTEVRNLKDGDWYWIPRAVVQCYAAKVSATGIAVYNVLASLANRSQSCFPSQKYIAERLGCSRATINKTIKVLEANGLITVEKRSRYHCIYRLLRVSCQAGETRMSKGRSSEAVQGDTNDNKSVRMNNNIDIDYENPSGPDLSTFKEFRPRNRQELLALDLADALNDRKGLPFYLFITRKYPESLLRRVLGQVKEIPERKIKKGRGALFNYLIRKHAQEITEDSGD